MIAAEYFVREKVNHHRREAGGINEVNSAKGGATPLKTLHTTKSNVIARRFHFAFATRADHVTGAVLIGTKV
jgi:hypothetical protein